MNRRGVGWAFLFGWLVVAALSIPAAAGYTADLTDPVTASAGAATASSTEGTLSPADAFDNDPVHPAVPTNGETFWGSAVKVIDTPQWLKYDFGAGNEKTVRRYRFLTTWNTGFQPDDWEFQGSNDDSNWDSLDSEADAGLERWAWYTYDFTNSTAYRYYRIYITGVADDTGNEWVDINEMEMMEWVGDPEIDVQRPAGADNSIADGGTDTVGNQTVGTVNLTYTIDNTAGTAQLTIPAGDVTASNYVNSSGFTVVTPLPLNVAAGGSSTLQVSFNVVANGAFSFDMDIGNNDAGENPYDITVSGTGTGGEPEIDVKRPGSIADGGTDNVGNQTVGTVNLTYTIDNTAGTDQLTIPAGGVTASNYVNSSGLTAITALPLNVAAGGSSTLQVSFNVAANGAFSLDMDIANNDGNENPYDIQITGTGTGGTPEIDVQRPVGTSIADGGTDNVGNQTVGTVNLTYTIDNTTGTDQLSVTGVTASNLSNASNFSLNTATPINVAAGATATFDISFDVDTNGAFSLDMDIANNDGDENPYDIAVSGNGTPGVYGKGDTDGDGDTDVVDARICLQIATGVLTGTAAQREAADVDGDGDVDETDAQILAEFIIGIRTTLP